MRVYPLRLVAWGLATLALLASCAAPAAPTPAPTPLPPTPAPPTATPAPINTALPTRTPTASPTVTETSTPTETPSPSDTPTLADTLTPTLEPMVTITHSTYLRNGPGTVYTIAGSAKVGQTLKAVGRDAASQWLVVVLSTTSKRQGWVSLTVATFNGDVAGLPEVATPPTPVPTPTPTFTPVPTDTPTRVRSLHNIVGEMRLCNPSKPTFATAIERVCFDMDIRNLGTDTQYYGALGVHAVNVNGSYDQFQPSWTGITGMLSVCGGCTGPTGTGWEDGIYIKQPGTYNLTLDICYSDLKTCQGNGNWETLTAPIQVTIVDWTPSP
jgi:hypothetical protein